MKYAKTSLYIELITKLDVFCAFSHGYDVIIKQNKENRIKNFSTSKLSQYLALAGASVAKNSEINNDLGSMTSS